MLKRTIFIFGLFIVLSFNHNANAQCCCDLGGTPVDLNCSLQWACEWLGGTWYNSSCATLPIELVYFHAEAKGDRVMLTWKTVAEINNDYFTVERSIDGMNWESVIEVQGEGNSSEARFYEARDDRPYPGLSYYRLKQTDFDGTSTYSNITAVQVITDKPYKMYPNPASNHITFIFNSDEKTFIRMTNQLGQQIFIEWVEGTRFANFNTSGLHKGLYLIYINRGNNSFTEKVIIR